MVTNKKVILLFTTLLVTVTLFSGCKAKSVTTPSSDKTAVTETAKDGKGGTTVNGGTSNGTVQAQPNIAPVKVGKPVSKEVTKQSVEDVKNTLKGVDTNLQDLSTSLEGLDGDF